MSTGFAFPISISNVCLLPALEVLLLLGVSVVQSQTVSTDFGNRSGATHVVPSGILAVGGVGSTLSDQFTINRLAVAGVNQTRFWISLSQIYATKYPNFTILDNTLERMKNSGVHPMAVMDDTPPSLGSKACAPPSDIWQWGQMAASVVAHVNQKFPGLLLDYEIWNEPEIASSLCISNDTTRLDTYISMFAEAAAAMHAQAMSDHEPIRTGGPTISNLTLASVWIPALLNNASAVPYVDFVSFHLYVSGLKEIDAGMTWSDLYANTQSSWHGLAHYYNLIEPLVRAGHQPNSAATPIYVSEFNDNWAFALDCCRNNATYGSLWNTVAIIDFLNVVYSGAFAVPSRLVYFNISGNYFCMMGEWNSEMDCNTSVLEPYPQFYTYELFASPDYLDLEAGGYMAVSVSPASTTSGLGATAFYTNTADSVVVINPTPTTYSAVNINLTNTGFTSPKGEVYLLDASHGKISSQPVALKTIAGGYSAEVEVPFYSTVALSIKSIQGGSAPRAVLTVTPQSGPRPLVVNIDSSQSQSGGSSIIGRTLDFGDGKWLNWTPTTSHTYNKAGNYTVRLMLKDQSGQISTANSVVTVD